MKQRIIDLLLSVSGAPSDRKCFISLTNSNVIKKPSSGIYPKAAIIYMNLLSPITHHMDLTRTCKHLLKHRPVEQQAGLGPSRSHKVFK